MNTNGNRTNCEGKRRTAAEVIDQELLAEGLAQVEIEQDRMLADLFEALLATGKTVDEINAEWDQKTATEILRDHSDLLSGRSLAVCNGRQSKSSATGTGSGLHATASLMAGGVDSVHEIFCHRDG